MLWEKLGRIFFANGQFDWMQTHSSLPLAWPLDNERVRIFFAPRDQQNRSCIAWLEIKISNPTCIVALGEEPLLAPGPLGHFDDCGVMPSWIFEGPNGPELYYIGWNVRNTVPFHHGLGRLLIDPVAPSIAAQRPAGPFMDRNEVDPFYVTNPCVLKDGKGWRMWYLSGVGWTYAKPFPFAKYVVKSAFSHDGQDWLRTGETTIDFKSSSELALARPSVIVDENGYHMWFSHRSTHENYRIGYAHSNDGLNWVRNDEASGPQPSASGWDSEMIAYPHVFDMAGNRYMLYCGNGYGRAGFGIAVICQ